MSYTVKNPINYSADPDEFDALALGKVYIGVPNGDPFNQPADRVQVYLARQGLSDLAINQPIDIGPGGVWYYNGSPAQIKVLVPYCVQVLNSLNVVESYAPAAGDEITKLNELETALDSAITVVDTFAALSSTTAAIGQKVKTLGHTQPGIGAATFSVVNAGLLVANTGTIALNGAIAFVMDNQQEACVEHFGAISGTNCTAAIQAQHDLLGTIRLGTKAGVYYHSGISIGDDVIIESKFKDGVLKVDNAAAPARGIDGRQRSRVVIRDVVIDGNNKCTVADIDMSWTIVGASTNNNIENVTVNGTKVLGIDLQNCGDTTLIKTRIQQPGTSTAIPFKWINSGGNILIRDVICNNITGRPIIYGQTMDIAGLTCAGVSVQGLMLHMSAFYSYPPTDGLGHIHAAGTVISTIVDGADITCTTSGTYFLSGPFGTGITLNSIVFEFYGTATAANCDMFHPTFSTSEGLVTINNGQTARINQVALQPFEVEINNVSTSSGTQGKGGILSTTALVAGTAYQNFYGGSIHVCHEVDVAAASFAVLQISTDNVTYYTVGQQNNTSGGTVSMFVDGIVPNAYYYKIGISGGAIGTDCVISRIK